MVLPGDEEVGLVHVQPAVRLPNVGWVSGAGGSSKRVRLTKKTSPPFLQAT